MTLTKTKISGIAVGSAMVLGTSPNSTVGKTTLEAPFDLRSAVSRLDAVSQGEASEDPIQLMQVRVEPVERRWTAGDTRRLRQLAAKRALLNATPVEEEEFVRLQNLRRTVTASFSGTDALDEWRRKRFVKDLLAVLNRNATFLTAKDQEKLRAFRNPTR
jgi:hypothetical protein